MSSKARGDRTGAAQLPLAIQWHEGMLLAPQHFQQEAMRRDALLSYHTQLLSPFPWGVERLEIDQAQLLEGTFLIRELEAVLPDGLAVAHSDQDGEDLMADVSPFGEQLRQEPATIWLTLAARRPGASPLRGELARFHSEDGPTVVDDNTGESELRIPRLRPRLGLLAGEEPPPKLVSLPLARVGLVNEKYTLTDYVPPLLRVQPKSTLGRMCRQLALSLRDKAAYLSEQASSPSLTASSPQLQGRRQMIHSLVGGLPPFEALLDSGQAHPFALYLGLTGLMGHAAAVGRSLVPPVPEPYDHSELHRCFTIAARFVQRSLDEGIAESYQGFPFERNEEVFSLPFDNAWAGRPLVLGVRRSDHADEGSAVAWLEASLIGTEGHLVSLRERRIRGAGRDHTEGVGDLLPSPGVSLFTLDTDPQYLTPGERLVIHNLDRRPGLATPVEIVLYVRNAAEGQTQEGAAGSLNGNHGYDGQEEETRAQAR